MIAWKATLGAVRATAPWLVLYWLLLSLTILWLYWPALCGEVPAFRDAFHFYYPLEIWLAARAEAGQYIPHFNPCDGSGTNLIGETSSGLCYPGRVLWWIPGMAVEQRFGVVLAVHTLIAAVGAAYAARRMNLSATAGCLAATAYALGGPVLFQHSNPVYLIGAAWTPWVLAECWVLAHRAEVQPRMGVWVAAAALMLLGGDPQATVNAGIVTLLALATRMVITRSWRAFGRQLLWLACAVLLVTGLTAVQWIPARSWLQHSHRAAARAISANENAQMADLPQLLRPLGKTLRQDPAEENVSQQRASSMYAYSIAPWHLLTLVWGTVGGHYLPDHTRWLQTLGGEPRMWTASLSIGLLPVLCVIAGWSHRPTRRGQRFLIALVIVSGAAMLGSFAPVWALRQACYAAGMDAWSRGLPGDEVGGVYWLFTKIVPGYSAFRYPAKWSVWFACGLALSAADAFDRQAVRTRLFARLNMLVAALCAVGAFTVIWLQWLPGGRQAYVAFASWLAAGGADPWLGRPDAAAVVRLWLQTALVAAAISGLCALFLCASRRQQLLRALVLILTLSELAWAGSKWLVTVDMDRLDAGSAVSLVKGTDGKSSSDAALLERIWASVGRADLESWSAALAVPTQPHREHVERVCNYQMAFRLGKLHLLRPAAANFSALLSLTPRSLAAVRHTIALADDLRADNRKLDETLAWLGVSQRLVAEERLMWQAVPNARPIVELVADAEVSEGPGPPADSCVVEHFAADRLKIKVSSSQATQLVVRLLQDGGWSATITPLGESSPERAATHRVPSSTHLGLFQSLRVPAGDSSIELTYRAPGWRLGLGISLGTLLFWPLVCGVRYAKRKRPQAGHIAQSN